MWRGDWWDVVVVKVRPVGTRSLEALVRYVDRAGVALGQECLVCVCVWVCVCARARVRACVCARVRVRACAWSRCVLDRYQGRPVAACPTALELIMV